MNISLQLGVSRFLLFVLMRTPTGLIYTYSYVAVLAKDSSNIS